jgi:hypothetical protein
MNFHKILVTCSFPNVAHKHIADGNNAEKFKSVLAKRREKYIYLE